MTINFIVLIYYEFIIKGTLRELITNFSNTDPRNIAALLKFTNL